VEVREPVVAAMAKAQWQREAPANVRLLSHLLQAQAEATPSPAASVSNLRDNFDAIQALIGHDSLADIAARLEQQAGGDSWLGLAAANFLTGSPTSAALIHALLQRARHLSLREVFQMEFDVAVGCCAHHDFAEGIRALLVDKDRKPRWQPERLAGVEPALVADHFKSRHAGPNPLADLR
jgi:enoyl-CoA hydratase/carnithine racemase